ncbi:MAG TPA: tripartite tricarboxylate transporter substrate binding protein [Candidatus Acidoferrum sp.]|nr:tripartite tricarboxylate transporter substrate binding protein [Candidatus Acidoferrum sp.]
MRKVVVLVALLSLGGGRAWSADYPVRDVEMIVSFPAGGPADASARILAPKLSQLLGVPIAVVNKTGGGGSVGADYVARARPDGSVIYNSTNAAFTISPVVLKDVTYKTGDFIPIGAYAADLGVITVRSGGPARTLEEFVEHAKKNPGKLTYGSAGLGTVSFFTMELFKQAFGVDVTHVPFQGTGPVKNAILGGHVNVATSGFGSLAPLIRSGDLIPLVTTAPKRLADFPQVPTMAEKGFPEASLNIWMGIYVPARTPKPVVDALTRAFNQAAKDPAVVGALDKAGMQGFYHTGEETARLLAQEAAVVAKVADKLGLRK